MLKAEEAWGAVPAEWKSAERARSLEHDDMQRAVDTTAHSLAREIYLRRRIWWDSNDHERIRGDGTLVSNEPLTSEANRHQNMARLLALLEEADDAPMQRVDLLRMLGRFDEAISLLKKTANPLGRLVGKNLEI